MLKYKGYIGDVVYDAEAKLFHGDVLGLRDVITFQGTNVEEIEQAFKDSIDAYLTMCEKIGEKPDKTYSGKFVVRIDPNLHAKLIKEAYMKNQTLNALVADKLSK